MSQNTNVLQTIYLPLLLLVAFFGDTAATRQESTQDALPYHATPPAPYAVPVQQPDGSVVHVVARGNPWQNWAETTDGYSLVKSKTGYYEYAASQGTKLVSNGIRAQDLNERSLGTQRALLAVNKHEKPTEDATLAKPVHAHHHARTQVQSVMPTEGKVNVLAICIDYPDLKATRSTDSFFNMFNGPSSKPTFKQYFQENSYGKLDMSVDVVGWVRARRAFRTYGNEGGFVASQDLVAEAIDGAEQRGVDFSKYDNDGDGNVDGVIIIHAGPGGEEGARNEYIWSHRWAINSRFYDGRNISDYTIQPETRYSGPVGIGIFCHEFGHLLGLPDLYDTDPSNGRRSGIGDWGLMGTGGWVDDETYPAGLSAWSKEALGWADVKDITTEYGEYTMRAASLHNEFLKIKTPNDNEYFLLENRQRSGVDRRLRGTGLAIWHIDDNRASVYPASNDVNAFPDYNAVDLEEADGRNDLDKFTNSGDQGDLFPGVNRRGTFNHNSAPNSDTHQAVDGSKESGISIENIEEADARVAFTYRNDGAVVGDDCRNPTTAVAGKNQAEKLVVWYTFTMPKNGGLSLRYANENADVSLYTACGEDPIAASGASSLTAGYLQQGQQLLIRWEFPANAKLPLNWNLSIENSVSDQDSLALVAIYQQTNGAAWSKKANWLNRSVSSWEGVKIKDGRVVELSFQEAGLNGRMPDDLYQLTALRKLIIKEPLLKGTLSDELTSLTQLETLSVEAPDVSATFLPQIARLNKLKQLSLISVAVNQAFPAALTQLKSLEKLVITDASMSGSISPDIENCRALQEVDLSRNQLQGRVPTGLLVLPNLSSLSLHNNRLETLPDNVLSSSALRYCYLHNNQLQGGLPREAKRDAARPITLTLGNNQLTGSVPEAWTSVTFDELTLNDNQLTGIFPPLAMPLNLDISANEFLQLPALRQSAFSQGKTSVLVCHSNRLTFEDLLPNRDYLACANCQDRYAPQLEVSVGLEQSATPGEDVRVILPFDADVSDSRYVWYKGNQEVAQTDINSLTVNSITPQQAGAYQTDVTNATLPGLVLQVFGISLDLEQKQSQSIQVPTIADKQFGDPPFAIGAQSSEGLPLTYQKVSGPVAIDGGQITIQGAGLATIKVMSPGNDVYAAVEQEISFDIAKAQPVIEVAPVADKSFDDDPFQLDIDIINDLSVQLTVEEGEVDIDNRWVTILGTGPVRITVRREASEDYEAANPVVVSFDVEKAEQTLTFGPIGDTTYVPGGEIDINTTLSSDLNVQYEVLSGAAEVVEGEVVMRGAGVVSIRASQPGNENYVAANAIEQTFTVAKASQEIYFERINDRMVGDPPFSLEAYSSSDQAVSFRVLRGPATVDDQGELSIQGDGEVAVEAYQDGDNNFVAAEPVVRSFLVQAPSKDIQTIVVGDLPDTVFVGGTVDLDIDVDSGLNPEVQIAGPATLSGRTISFLGEGEVAINVSQPGNGDFNAAATFVKTIVVLVDLPPAQPLAQNLVFGPTNRQYGDSIEVSSSSGLALLLEVVSGPARITETGLVEMTGLGTVQVRTVQEGTGRYAAIDTVIEFSVAQAVQIVEFGATELSDSTYLLQATSNSGLPVTYELQSGEGVLRGDTLVVRTEDSVVVTASQAGNEFYEAAVPQQLALNVPTVTSTDDPADYVLSIYPNPSPAVFRIDLSTEVQEATYRVFNTYGQVVQQGQLRLSDTFLDLSGIATGSYVLYLQTDQGVSQHRLLKQ